MDRKVPRLRDVQRKTWLSTFMLNLAGAFIVYLYITVVDPLPQGSETISAITPAEFIRFLAVLVVTFSLGITWRIRSDRRIARWSEFLENGGEAKDIPATIQREVLQVPFMTALRTFLMWPLAGLFFILYTGSFRVFLAIAGVGGLLASTLTFLVVETFWRPVIPRFFPEGRLSLVRALRLPLFGRLLFVILLVGLLPYAILANVTWQRAQALLTAENAQAVLENLYILEVFLMAANVLFGTGLAIFVTRSITIPVKNMQNAMARVERNDFQARVPVEGNDELGYLSERFNQMTEGLRQGKLYLKLFGMYVSPEVARAAVERGAGLGGELVTSTILFSDLRDFTHMSEQMPPERLINLINRYMTVMVRAITENGGIVTRFAGDSILAVFGTPLNPSDRHAAQAVQAALDMRQTLRGFNEDQEAAGDPVLRMGIGIATGQVVAGNVGDRERIEYTVMGDATNLASRLQDKTKELEGDILLSEATYRTASAALPMKVRELTGVPIKGKQQEVTVYLLENE